MRNLISQNSSGNKHTASEVLQQIYHFDSRPYNDINEHWFRVELIGINEENYELLDFLKIKEYLSFIAPVPYQNKFLFRKKVYEHAASLSQHIDEYNIELNGEQVFKKYGTHFKTSKGNDEIFDIMFKDFYDSQGTLVAWMWVGLSRFKAIIEKECPMRGIRLRKENIQIGNADALQKLFREDRGNHYFVGEIFAVARELIPNSQRDYFNENSCRFQFETYLRNYFNDELHRLYYEGSAINSAFSKIDALKQKEEEHQKKALKGDYVDDEQRMRAEQIVEKARKDAAKAQRDLNRKRADSGNSVVARIITRIDDERAKEELPQTQTQVKIELTPQENASTQIYRADRLSRYSKKERKLISRIFKIILASTDEKSAEKIITKIEDELQ